MYSSSKSFSFLLLYFFSLFSSTVNVLLSGQMHEESQNDSYHLSLLLAARLADRSCLSWDREGLVQLSYEPLQEPLCLFHKPLWSHQKQTPPKKYKQKTKMQTQQPMATKEFKTEKKKKIRNKSKGKKKRKKSSCFQYKTFSRPSFFSLILMTFFLKIFFSLSTLKSIKNLYRNTEKSQGKTL